MILAILFALSMKTKAQIPNSGFENWTTVGGHDSLVGWFSGNATLSTDHYPASIGQYSVKLSNNLPLTNRYSYGYSVTNSANNGCLPSFAVTGHPTQLCGYYKCFPANNDTIQIGLMLFKNGVWVAGAELTSTDTVAGWTSFCIPISAYSSADSATITVAAFYNDTTCAMPYGPYGNSVLYVDNLSFDNLLSSVPENTARKLAFNLYPNPAADFVTLHTQLTQNEELSLFLYNTVGDLVKSETLKHNTQKINLQDLGDGIYLLLIQSKNFIESKRLIIQR